MQLHECMMDYGSGLKRKRRKHPSNTPVTCSSPLHSSGEGAPLAGKHCFECSTVKNTSKKFKTESCEVIDESPPAKHGTGSCNTRIDEELDSVLFSDTVLMGGVSGVSEIGGNGDVAGLQLINEEISEMCAIDERELRIKDLPSRVNDRNLPTFAPKRGLIPNDNDRVLPTKELEEEEDDFLSGLYPEDFSFTLNSSAVLPHEEQRRCSHGKENDEPSDSVVTVTMDSIPDSPASSPTLPHAQHLPISFHPLSSSPTSSQPSTSLLPLFQSSTSPLSAPPPPLSIHSPRPLSTASLHSLSIPPPQSSVPSFPCCNSVTSDGVKYPVNTFYGLPLTVQSCLEEHKGIIKLYDWQDDCLRLPSVHKGSNLVYSLPTSGGKTLVAELIIFRQLLFCGKDVLFILPFVSIVQEKVRELGLFASELGFAVEEYAAGRGTFPPRKRRKKNVVYVATIEKANSLANSLIELQRVSELGLVVIDELHMVGDGSERGATLEACIAKIRHTTGSGTQLIGMSATLSNIKELATFMNAQVYSSDFRPVELMEFVKLGRSVYSVSVKSGGEVVDFLPVRQLPPIPSSSLSQLDPDQLCSLVLEVVPHGSCLVFCPTKKNCQNVALLLSKSFPSSLKHGEHSASRQSLLQQLSIEASGVCPILQQTVPYGVAYHHSGLTADERKVIEDGYLDGSLSVLACTSTLAAGVNLPARRVILRSPYMGKQLLTRSQYKQMVGRAGRSGMCDTGESILILQEHDKPQVKELFSGPYEKCKSSLLVNDMAALLSLILTLIGLKLIKTFEQLWNFLSCTLLYVQSEHSYLKQCCNRALKHLATLGYVTLEAGSCPDETSYFITTLGRATYRGCLPVKQAHLIYKDLIKGHQCLILATDLHLLYYVTPPELGPGALYQPNWMVYFKILTELGPDELKVAEMVGVDPAVLSKKATGIASKMSPETTLLYMRFYQSLMLHCLLKMGTLDAMWKVAHTFQCSRGFIQTLLSSAASFAFSLVHFSQELPELWSLSVLLPVIGKKLSYSSSADLIPLMEVSGIKQGRARQLVLAGITTPEELAVADPHTLSQNISHLYHKQAKRLINAAKAFVADRAEILLEEAEELMTLLPQSATM